MSDEQTTLQRARYYSSVTLMYSLTLLCGFYIIGRPSVFQPTEAMPMQSAVLTTSKPAPKPQKVILAGKPNRITVPALSIDLVVEDGQYDPATGGWTLSGYRAHFAVTSAPANNDGGNTFIYGHNNNHVFGTLRKKIPDPGTQALIYTTNGHVFSYMFSNYKEVKPDDTSILDYTGSPILTIQTCSGSWDEWRRLLVFSFDKVVQ